MTSEMVHQGPEIDNCTLILQVVAEVSPALVQLRKLHKKQKP